MTEYNQPLLSISLSNLYLNFQSWDSP